MEQKGENAVRSAALLALVREGDSGAFAKLEELYAPLLHTMKSRFSDGLCQADADEVGQETSIAFYRAAKSYKENPDVTFGLYARVCINNALVSLYRKRRSVPMLSWEELDEESAGATEEPILSVIGREEEQKALSRIQKALSPFENQIFSLYREGYRTPEIAKKVGRSEKSVSNAIFRMLRKLQREFGSP